MSKVKLTPAKLAELRQKAAGCDPKYWIMDQHGDVVAVDFDNKNTKLKIASVDFLDDAELIAAADPATVLAMVDEIERFRHFVRETLDELHECYNEESCKICKEIDRVIESEAGQ